MFKYLQQQVNPKMLLLMMVSIFLLILLSFYLYVFKQPLANLKQAQQTIELMQAEAITGISLPDQLTSTQNDIDKLEQQLQGSAPSLPLNQKIAEVIGRLGAISVHHKINLNSVKPGEVSEVFMFQELPFNIEISGTYFKLFDWLLQIEQELGPITVKSFTLQPDASGDNITMKLTLASYLFTDRDKP